MHWPEALQVDGPVYTSAVQVSAAQTVVPAGYLRQPPAPSHLPSVPQVEAPISRHIVRGSAAPATDIVHLPTEPASAQLRHAPVHAVLQQTPSTQCWFKQSPSMEQACPSTLGPQLPVATTHAWPSAQSALVVHFEMQAFPVHL